ncbi:MAG TPA: RNA-binding S4 domain-containing protein [Stellaceae bacterium]|nr:RNA-binding S4 domain-containing protein [Stellaceae bacterium]
MSGEEPVAEPVAAGHRRLDQWLWFARLVKSRSLAVRLIAAGAVTRNGAVVKKANQAVRIGDCLIVPQGRLRRTVHVLALGTRRGPFSEARLLYQETAAPVPSTAEWVPLLADEPEDEDRDALR